MESYALLGLERLEARWCPALTVALNRGTLSISGTADSGLISITQDATTAGTITVLDGSTPVTGNPFTGVANIRLNLTSAADNVTLNLGTKTLSGNVLANLGGGANRLTVIDGGIGGRLVVSGGDGDDTVVLGDGDALALREADLALFGGTDSATVSSGVTISRSIATQFVNNVTLAAGSTTRNAIFNGGTGGNTFTLAGDVTGDVILNSYFGRNSTAGTTANIRGDVDGSVVFNGSNLADTLNVSGSIGKNLVGSTLGGNDTVSITGTVTRSLTYDTGAGDDAVTISGTIGGRTNLSTGAGNDTLTMTGTAKFLAAALIALGAGNDAATLETAATIVTMLINGGTGTDTFTGTSPRTGLTLISF